MAEKSSDIVHFIRELLRRDEIKLWLPPYVTESGEQQAFPQELLENYSQKTGSDQGEVEKALTELRSKALSRLAQKKQFEETGLAVLHVSFLRDSHNPQNNEEFDLEISLNSLGSEFMEKLSEKCQVRSDELKLISNGNFVDENRLLSSQNILNQSQILCIQMTPEEIAANRDSEWRKSVDKTRAAATRLAGKATEISDHTLEVEDQMGNVVEIPPEEKQRLAVGMTMHEKGRAAEKKKNYGLALVFLLEADTEFRECRHAVLLSVDNYAILNLDIVWCYLKLKKVDCLPDAELRLNQCEQSFKRVYGRNFERLLLLRKGVDLERALLVRLRVLEGILCFFQKKYAAARDLLNQSSKDIKAMDVDDTLLAQIVSMGYTVEEGRLGLRASKGNIAEAVTLIMEERGKQTEHAQADREEQRKKALRRRLGKTANGEFINVEVYEQLVEMGFLKKLVMQALRDSNNDMNAAIELMRTSDQDQGADALSAEEEHDDGDVDEGEVPELIQQMRKQLQDMGYDMEKIKGALKKADFSIEAAIKILGEETEKVAGAGKILSNEEIEDLEAWKELEKDVGRNPRDHLDLSFEDEKQLIEEYLTLTLVHL